MAALGRTTWVIAEGYIPGESTGPPPQLLSHEAVLARRTLHQWFNDLTDPAPIPRDTDYASVISDHPVVAQHTRLDSRQPANALISTVAFPV
jgi:hypothetical protein